MSISDKARIAELNALLDKRERQIAHLRDALEQIRENTPSQQKLEYDDGDIYLGDFINRALAETGDQ